MDKNKEVKRIVKKAYSKVATSSNSTCCQCGCGTLDKQTVKKLSKSIGYYEEEMNAVPEAKIGLGYGSPIAFSSIKEGDTVHQD